MNKLFDLFADIEEAAFAISEEQQIIFWNSAAAKLLLHRATAVLGQPCWQVIGGVTQSGRPFCQPNCPIIRQMQAGLAVQSVDLLVKSQAGLHTLVNVSTIPMAGQATNGQRPLLLHLLRPQEGIETPLGALRLYMLGPLIVQRVDGSYVNGPFWQNRSVRALLVYLAQAEHDPVEEDELLEVFWPNLPRCPARASLATAVHHLRLSLEPDLLDTTVSHYILRHKNSYQINPDIPLWFDLDHVTAVTAVAYLEPNPHRALQTYQESIQLFRGSFLQDLLNQPVWSLNSYHQVHKLKCTILEALGDLCQQLHQPQQAKGYYLDALTIDHDNDAVFQKLVQLALPQEVRLDTLRHCQKLAVTLRSQIDLILAEELRPSARHS